MGRVCDIIAVDKYNSAGNAVNMHYVIIITYCRFDAIKIRSIHVCIVYNNVINCKHNSLYNSPQPYWPPVYEV